MIGEGERQKIITIFDEINFIGPARREMILPYGLQLKAIAEKETSKTTRCQSLSNIKDKDKPRNKQGVAYKINN